MFLIVGFISCNIFAVLEIWKKLLKNDRPQAIVTDFIIFLLGLRDLQNQKLLRNTAYVAVLFYPTDHSKLLLAPFGVATSGFAKIMNKIIGLDIRP